MVSKGTFDTYLINIISYVGISAEKSIKTRDYVLFIILTLLKNAFYDL